MCAGKQMQQINRSGSERRGQQNIGKIGVELRYPLFRAKRCVFLIECFYVHGCFEVRGV
jgi:hypothetical protein